MSFQTDPESHVYKAPAFFVGSFYLIFAVFILVDFSFLILLLKNFKLSYAFPMFMLIFMLVYMGYFSIAISHKIEVWTNGKVKLTSLRKIITTNVEDLAYVQGPQLPIGFIKLRLERQKSYLFAKMGTPSLNTVLMAIKMADPGIKFDRIKKWTL